MSEFLGPKSGEGKQRRRAALLATVAFFSIIYAGSASAQTPIESAQRGQSLAIEEIVVTARQRAETLQQVPLAITAFSGEQLNRAGVTDLRTLANQTVGLQMDGLDPRSFSLPVIRGVSQVSRSDDENNTAIFLDGVYVSGRDGLDVSLLDLERVEIVKGPQSALYGKNSYAGAINYNTKKPGNDIIGRVSGTVGEDGNEWVADCWHETYLGAPSDQAARLIDGDCGVRAMRGQGWTAMAAGTRSAFRLKMNATDRRFTFAIRVARDLTRDEVRRSTP
jgi:outer membrane receptor protein involved in Fe transport